MTFKRSYRKPSEQNLQIACVNWFKYQYPNILIHHSPNGGKRNVIEAAKFKNMGVKAGFPDIFIGTARNDYHGLFIEMKYGKGSTTDNQENVILKLKSENYKVEVCKSVDEFMNVVNGYLKG